MQSTLIQAPPKKKKICISGPLQTEVLGMEECSLGHYYKLGAQGQALMTLPTDRSFFLSFLTLASYK